MSAYKMKAKYRLDYKEFYYLVGACGLPLRPPTQRWSEKEDHRTWFVLGRET